MIICVLKESLSLGGTERSAANISKALSKTQQVFTVLYDGSNPQYTYGGELVNLNLPAKNGLAAKVINNMRRANRYNKFIKTNNIELLFEFLSIGSPLCALRHKKQIRVISLRDFGVLQRRAKRFHKCLSRADAMVCNSGYLRDYYIAKYPEHKDRVFTIYNIIDIQDICAQGAESVEIAFNEFCSAHPKTVVAVGRFCREKGFEYLIRSIAEARKKDPQIGLVLVGVGSYCNGYREIVAKEGQMNHVFFAGYQSNPYKYMAKCSCFVLSSVSEGFPNVLAEAMALHLPVISTNCLTGPAEILRDDADYSAVKDRYELCDYGILTPRFTAGAENDAAVIELSNAICALLASHELMEKYAGLAGQRVLQYSEKEASKKLNEMFSVLKARRKS